MPADQAAKSAASLSQFPAPFPIQAEAIAIIDARTGRLRNSSGKFAGLAEVAELVAEFFTNQSLSVDRLGTGQTIDEIVITTARFWSMTRPLKTDPLTLALLVFDPQQANMVMERLELDDFVSSIEAWLD